MAVVTKKPKTRRIQKGHRAKSKTTSKNGHRKTKAIQPGDVYLLRPRRTPEAIRRGKRLAALVRKELEAAMEETTLEQVMQSMRGRGGWL